MNIGALITNLWLYLNLGVSTGLSQVGTYFPLALAYILLAVIGSYLLVWGTIGYEKTKEGNLELRLPGGGLLAALPIWEAVLLGVAVWRAASTWDGLVLQFLTLMFVVRVILWAVTHLMIFIGRLLTPKGGGLILMCMDGRCKCGSHGGLFVHGYACGGFTLLTAMGFAPLLPLALIFGIPEGLLGGAIFVALMLPYNFLFGKLMPKFFRLSDSTQKVVKRIVDLQMLTEVPGLFLAQISTSVAGLQLMVMGLSKTRLH